MAELAKFGVVIVEKVFLSADPSSVGQWQGGRYHFSGYYPPVPARHARLMIRGSDGRLLIRDGDTGLTRQVAFLEDGIGGEVAPHAESHHTGGTDPLAPGDIGAADELHASQHATGGADELAPADIGAAEEIHASQHATGGADPLAPGDIGAATASHTHARTISVGWYEESVAAGNELGPVHELDALLAPSGATLKKVLYNAKSGTPHTGTITLAIERATARAGPWSSIFLVNPTLAVGTYNGATTSFWTTPATIAAGTWLRFNVVGGDGSGLHVTLIMEV